MSVWDDVVGQPEAVAVLRQAAAAAAGIVAAARTPEPQPGSSGPAGSVGPIGGMTHAWLFTGPPGSGRSVAARAFAAALQCPTQGCGSCASCRTVLAGTHADVRVVIPEGLSIAVKDMRALVLTAAARPSGGRWHVVIITDADRLGEAAGNALLKAVEEPAERTVFLLCAPSTHPDDIPVTLRSRCRVVPLRTPTDDAIAEVLVRRDGVDPAGAAWAAAASQGHVGRARRLATDADAKIRRGAVLDLPLSLRSLSDCFAAAEELLAGAGEEAAVVRARDAPETRALEEALGAGGTGKGATGAARGAAGQLKELEKKQRVRATRTQRDAIDRTLVDLAGFYRDVLVVHAGGTARLSHRDRITDVRRVARVITAEGALRRLEAILATREAIEANAKPRVAVEALAVALRLPR